MGYKPFPRTVSCTGRQLRGSSKLGGVEPPSSIPGQLNFKHWKDFQAPWLGSNHRFMHMIFF